jgi:hypothetical protein
MLVEHPEGTCPECPGTLLYRFSATVNGWRVVFLCARTCGFTDTAGTIDRADIDHRDERHERAVAMGEQFV